MKKPAIVYSLASLMLVVAAPGAYANSSGSFTAAGTTAA